MHAYVIEYGNQYSDVDAYGIIWPEVFLSKESAEKVRDRLVQEYGKNVYWFVAVHEFPTVE